MARLSSMLPRAVSHQGPYTLHYAGNKRGQLDTAALMAAKIGGIDSKNAMAVSRAAVGVRDSASGYSSVADAAAAASAVAQPGECVIVMGMIRIHGRLRPYPAQVIRG